MIAAVRHLEHIPVVQVSEFPGRPLHVFAGFYAFAANMVGVDRGLVPVDVQDGVRESRRGCGCERLRDPARRHAALAFDDMHPRGGLRPVEIDRREREPERRRNPDPRSAGGDRHSGSGRSGMPVEGSCPEALEERRLVGGVAAEPEQVLEAELQPFVGWQEVGGAGVQQLVAERPHRVETERLVSGGVDGQVVLRRIGFRGIGLERGEEEGCNEAPRRNRAAGMPGGGDEVVEHAGQRAIGEVEALEVGDELGRGLNPREAVLREHVGDRHIERAAGSEAQGARRLKSGEGR